MDVACESDKSERESLPDWSEAYEGEPRRAVDIDPDGGTPGSFPDDSFGIAISEDITYPIRIRELSSTDRPCAIEQGSSDPEIRCVLEMNELDLNYLGLKYDIIAPDGMCDFISYSSYMFENFRMEEGPTEVSWTVEEDGSITDEVNAVGDEPVCPADYSRQYAEHLKAPNCCFGEYTRTVTHAQTGKVSVSRHNWNGNPAGCFHGAAFMEKRGECTDGGWPLDRFIYINREKLEHTVEYDYPAREGWPNLVLANFYDPADHGGQVPAGLRTLPDRVHFHFLCVDDAEEIIAHVELVVREWNEEAEFDVDGDPDTEGLEAGWGTPINDLDDWADVQADYDGYPRVLPPPDCTQE